jgi:hypothetical protein
MKQTAYLETTIPSYLTAWRSNELIMAASQQATCRAAGYEPPVICTPPQLMEIIL